jgi:hypothetical protein
MKHLEKLISERGYKNDPVILRMLQLIKNQEKRIKNLEEHFKHFQTSLWN